MSVFYLDASAWVKRYVQEAGSASLHALFARGPRLATATLGYVETVAALSRRLAGEQRYRSLSRLEQDGRYLALLDVDRPVITQAADLARQYQLRGADAIHLAAALRLQDILAPEKEELTLVGSDRELLTAAQHAGLLTQDPVFTPLVS